jgi:hypothetical protein
MSLQVMKTAAPLIKIKNSFSPCTLKGMIFISNFSFPYCSHTRTKQSIKKTHWITLTHLDFVTNSNEVSFTTDQLHARSSPNHFPNSAYCFTFTMWLTIYRYSHLLQQKLCHYSVHNDVCHSTSTLNSANQSVRNVKPTFKSSQQIENIRSLKCQHPNNQNTLSYVNLEAEKWF